jgi:hypothetical protein
MWFKDWNGTPINTSALLSLYVAANPDDGTYYVVQGNIPDTTAPGGYASPVFGTSATMSEADATALLGKMALVLGVINPADL